MKRPNILTILIVLFSFVALSGFARPEKDVSQGNKKSIKSVGSGCLPPTSSSYLEFNNVKAMIHNGGDMWWDLAGTARYVVPKDGGVSALFAGSIWVGGTDTNGQLRFAGNKFRALGVDYYPGPLVKSGENKGNVTPEICTRYDRHYYVTRSMVTEFIGYKNSENPEQDFPGYSVPEVIANWPAHGPTEDIYDYYLAPFKDVDGDGAYNPGAGDYPYYIFNSNNYDCNSVPENIADSLDNEDMQLFGDATLWWVYNDRGNVHGETNGEAIGMEFRAQAFAFATDDELNNMTFYNYQIINRSTYTLKEAYFGVWTDADMGYAFDDYVGCDVKRGLGYIYNGDDDDDVSGPGYGKFPPAIGIDFFEGPYKDKTNNDELSSYGPDGTIVCDRGFVDVDGDGITDSVQSLESVYDNGNINGLNFGDGIADNERWGMRRFIYFTNGGGNYGDPVVAQDYYRYLTGFWKNGKRMTHGGSGHDDGPLDADFMYPGETDNDCFWGTSGNVPTDTDWTQYGTDGTPADQRFVQSAGPFTLEPGNVNDITTGAVWARAYDADPFASVKAVQKADDKAQTLFEQCFQLIDGPDAPELSIIEMDQKFIVHISNPVESNNYLEQYNQADPFLVNYADNKFKFQGYQVYQLVDPTVSLENLRNNNFSQLVFQCDLKDDIGNLVNWYFDADINGFRPEVMVEANNNGIQHTFEITTDKFSTGSSNKLVNNKKYYFVAVAYAHNEFEPYIQTDSTSLNGQKEPYLGSRKGVNGQIKTYEVIPHPTNMQDGGNVLFADYGDQPSVTKIEGEGNGRRYLKLADGVEDEIMTNYNDKEGIDVTYAPNHGPLNVKIVDPFNVKAGTYYVGIDHEIYNPEHFVQSALDSLNAQGSWGLIADSKWFLAKEEFGYIDTLAYSPNFLSNKNEVVFDTLGISVEIELFEYPMSARLNYFEHLFGTGIQNGYVGSSMTFDNPEEPWLDFIPDDEGQTYSNWIRSGSSLYANNPEWNDLKLWPDPDQVFENVVFGKWSPYRYASFQKHGPSHGSGVGLQVPGSLGQDWPTSSLGVTLPSVDIVLTKDRSKWTRVPVFEMAENTVTADGDVINPNSEGGVLKFQLRAAPSLDKDGNSSTSDVASLNPNDPNFVSDSGWSWFPGYAIDLDNGRRLMMAFGESSWLVGHNGRDMLWNPVETIYSEDDNVIFGGKHFIYVFASETNFKPNPDIYMDSYVDNDETRGVFYLRDKLEEDASNYLKFIAWTAIPYTRTGYQFNTYDEMPDNDLRIELRVAKPYVVGKGMNELADPMNYNYPIYKFTLDDYVPEFNVNAVAEDALESVNVVPNPYYGGNNYETAPLEYLVKITNLPRRASIKIYNMAGTLVRSFEKDNASTIVEWDLKNNYQVPIAGGMYIIHVEAPGVGEKTLKWFGVLRPDDLSSF
ncbi:MAG: hypothetical protein C0599_13130 [Salinivirgaceae bacterium]|nr:MAG: hypothetical protein C0599_13130 [Salinivirgaceae bacterium]